MQYPQVYVPGQREKKIISRKPICLTDADHNYILEEIGSQYKIGFEREVDVYSDDMED